jgi:hypothetical protein
MRSGAASPGARNAPAADSNVLALVITVVGTILLIYGLSLYAKAKGYHRRSGSSACYRSSGSLCWACCRTS